MDQLDRITQQPEVMGGKACIRGMRVTVGMIVGQIGSGQRRVGWRSKASRPRWPSPFPRRRQTVHASYVR